MSECKELDVRYDLQNRFSANDYEIKRSMLRIFCENGKKGIMYQICLLREIYGSSFIKIKNCIVRYIFSHWNKHDDCIYGVSISTHKNAAVLS